MAIASNDSSQTASLRRSLEAPEAYEIVATASDYDALKEVDETVPDVLIVSLDGPSSLEQIRRAASHLPVLAIALDGQFSVLEVLEAGALGIVPIQAVGEELEVALELIMNGQIFVSPELLGRLLRTVIERRRTERVEAARLNVLTKREREVFELVGRGMDRNDIARELTISADTVRTHIQRVFGKLDLHSMAEAVVFAYRCGLLGRGPGKEG